MPLIVFVGPPGAGKSTQMRVISGVMGRCFSKYRRVVELNLKRGFLASLLERLLMLLVYGKRLGYPYPLELLLRGASNKTRKVVKLWFYINTLELASRILLLARLAKIFGLILLIEDYVPAIIVDYVYVALKLGLPINSIMKFIKILLQVYSKEQPLKIIFLSATKPELIKRWYIRKRGEHSELYISLTRVLMLNLVMKVFENSNKALVIDTSDKSIGETATVILRHVCSMQK